MERRTFLSLAGSTGLVAVAGCSGVLNGDDSPPRIEADAMAEVVSDPPPDPVRPTPVQPSAAAVESSLDRGDTLLARVPESPSPEEVPDEDVRRRIVTTRERALGDRADAENAPGRFHALWETARFRQRARTAATIYEAVGSDLREDIEDERTAVERALRTQHGRLEYTGADRDRTLLLAARLEDRLTAGRRALAGGYGRSGPEPIQLGRLAGDAEYARAITDAVAHLSDRHAADVDDPADFTQTFDAALGHATEALADYVHPADQIAEQIDSAGDRPSVSHLVNTTLVTPRRFQGFTRHATRRHLAFGLDEALGLARDGRATEAALKRVENGEFPPPETVDRVREERSEALAAVEAVDVDPSEPSLPADVYARTVQLARHADENVRERVASARDEGRDVTPALPYAQYAALRARLESLPDAVAAFQGWFGRRPNP